MSTESTERVLLIFLGRVSPSARAPSSRINFLALRLAFRAVRLGFALRGQSLPPACGPVPRDLNHHLP